MDPNMHLQRILRLEICSGPAYGTGSSHRAEATGMLSAARFLFHLAQYCNSPIVNQLVYISDNKGLITRMRQQQEYKTCFPNVTLAPDWDLTEAIHDSNQHLAEPPKYRHVLGHQDKMTHYTQLPLTARLNVDADEAAGAFHWSHATTIQAAVALLPTVEIQYLAPLSLCYSFTVAQVTVKGSTRNVSLVTFSLRFN
jgi:hypothetical protein